MNKVNIKVKKQIKVDGRNNNTGRPVNKKSARQVRLAKQRLYARLNKQFVSGRKFLINNADSVYVYKQDSTKPGYIINDLTGSYVCTVNYIGRTKVLGGVFVLDKYVNIEINLKNVDFVK